MPKNKDVNLSDKPAFEDAALGFVYKSLINRDPNKRRIKPVESILSFDADLDDSESDDSDYNPPNVDDDDDVEIESDGDVENGDQKGEEETKKIKKTGNNSISNGNNKNKKNNSEHAGDKNGTNDSCGSSSSSEDDDTSSDDLDEDDEEEEQDTKCSKVDTKLSSNTNEENSSLNTKKQTISDSELTEHYKKIVICSVCMGDVSHNDDEIVECDACGISVHELCYGITPDDAESVHSNASSASTEPWFCDPCKAGVKTPLCELCPNSGGIYKITDNARWVHMVCALYTQGVTFADTEKLRGPVLSEINYSRWGSKACMLCEDDRFSQTGVCISCDAGMCKTFFHVTCAQREGLLTEVKHADEVDPYIAYCRLHSDRNAAKKKRRNYLALLAKNRFLNKSQSQCLTIEESITNQRTLSKLISHREKFMKNFHELENHLSAPSKKIPRLLDASPSAMRRLSTRSELSGFNNKRTSYLNREDITDIRRKWYIPPAFSVEFVSYYIDRNDRISSMQTQSQELIKQNKHLKEVESSVFNKYNNILSKTEHIKAENEAIRAKIHKYLSILSSFVVSNSSSHSEEEQIKSLKLGRTILNLPEMQPESSKSKNSANKQGSNKAEDCSGASGTKDVIFQLKECATCKNKKDQHLLALCDSCHLYYHLHCLDPPLRRMPKKTRFGGWQCSNCTEKDEEQNEQDFNESDCNTQNNINNNSVMSSSLNENESSTLSSDANVSGSASTVPRRRLRENPKAACRYSDRDDVGGGSISSIAITAQISNSSANSRKRSRNRNGKANSSAIATGQNSASNANNKKGRKPRTSSPATGASASTITISTPTTTGSGRKRKHSSSVETISPVVETNAKNSGESSEQPVTVNNISSVCPVVATPKRSVIECFRCHKEATNKLSVRCDNCENFYHFACLIPPCVKSPKRRGYTWCCYVCEKSEEKRSDSMAPCTDVEMKAVCTNETKTNEAKEKHECKTNTSEKVVKSESETINNQSELLLLSKSTKDEGKQLEEDKTLNDKHKESEQSQTNETKEVKVEVSEKEKVNDCDGIGQEKLIDDIKSSESSTEVNNKTEDAKGSVENDTSCQNKS